MIQFFAPVNILGTGVHAWNLMKAFEAVAHQNIVALFPPFGRVDFADEQVGRWLENRETFDAHAPSVMIFDMGFLPYFAGSPRIGFSVFETDVIRKFEVAYLHELDQVLVPSEWGRRVLSAHGVKASVVREGVDPDVFFPPTAQAENSGAFRFVTVGKFEERKGTLDALRAFTVGIRPFQEPAELVMHIANPFIQGGDFPGLGQVLREFGYNSVDGANFRSGKLLVRLMAGGLPFDRMRTSYQASDCGIFPTKGEGWGLPILECIACGTPAIVGNWTGQSEFIGEKYPAALAIATGTPEEARDGIWFTGDRGHWIVPSFDEMVQRVRWAFLNARTLKASGAWRALVAEKRSEFSWANAGLRLSEVINGVTI